MYIIKERNIRMERKKYIIYAVCGVILIFMLSFFAGFIITKKKVRTDTEKVPQAEEVFSTAEKEEQAEEINSYYIIRSENNMIKLSYVENGEITELCSEEVALDVFPNTDINMLKNGIYADSENEAYAVWENFIS